jgi:hypothetical protein
LRLGLRGLARAVVGAVLTCVLGLVCAAVLTAVGAGGVATADGSAAWTVTVGDARGTLYPGTGAAMSYEVRNLTSGTQRLGAISVELRNDGVGLYDTDAHRYADGCLARWFRVTAHDAPTDVEVAAGASVKGTLALDFEDAPVSQDACQNIGVEVVVNAS